MTVLCNYAHMNHRSNDGHAEIRKSSYFDLHSLIPKNNFWFGMKMVH